MKQTLNKIAFISTRPHKNYVYISTVRDPSELISSMQQDNPYMLQLDYLINTSSDAVKYQLSTEIAPQRLMGHWYKYDINETGELYRKYEKIAALAGKCFVCRYCGLNFDSATAFHRHLHRCRIFSSHFDDVHSGNGS